jgi:hypothetical protein
MPGRIGGIGGISVVVVSGGEVVVVVSGGDVVVVVSGGEVVVVVSGGEVVVVVSGGEVVVVVAGGAVVVVVLGGGFVVVVVGVPGGLGFLGGLDGDEPDVVGGEVVDVVPEPDLVGVVEIVGGTNGRVRVNGAVLTAVLTVGVVFGPLFLFDVTMPDVAVVGVVVGGGTRTGSV